MSAVVYRAPDRELNLNESDKSRWGNTQTPIAGLCVGEAKRRRDRVKKHSLQTVNQVQKDGLGLGFFFFFMVEEGVCNDKEGNDFSFPYLSFYDHCFYR